MPGETETQLLLRYAIPLAVKLLKNGSNEGKTVEVVNKAIVAVQAGDVDIGEKLANATDEEAASIVDALFGILTGVVDGLFGLLKALGGLLK